MQEKRPLIKILLNQSAVSHMTGGSTVWSKDWTKCPRLFFHGRLRLSKFCKSLLSTRSWSVCFGHVTLPGCHTLSILVECQQWPQNSTWRWTASLITTGAGVEKTMTSPPGKGGSKVRVWLITQAPFTHALQTFTESRHESYGGTCNISTRPQSQNSSDVFYISKWKISLGVWIVFQSSFFWGTSPETLLQGLSRLGL